MKHLAILLTLLLGTSAICMGQVSSKIVRERKKLVKNYSPKQVPTITLDSRTISLEDFLRLPDDTIAGIVPYKTGEHPLFEETVIDIKTHHYFDSIHVVYRVSGIQRYREHEMETFFGNDEPLILFGERQISRNEFIHLPEDTVAFVNFYFSDFVKDYYGPKAKHGLVYVCPRAARSTIIYNDALPLPANGRNYMDSFSTVFGGTYDDPSNITVSRMIQNKLSQYKALIDKDVKATVYVSCIIHTDGRIEPNIIERFDNATDEAMKQRDMLINISKEIITSLPLWEPANEVLYNRYTQSFVSGQREVSVTLPVRFL